RIATSARLRQASGGPRRRPSGPPRRSRRAFKRRVVMSLPKTALAAVVAEYGKPIEIRELPVPQEAELEPGALLVRVDVASICGSDVHQWDGMTQARGPAPVPIVLGPALLG